MGNRRLSTRNNIESLVLVRPSTLEKGFFLRSYRLMPGGENAFSVPAETLFDAWLSVADRQPRTQRLAADPGQKCSLHVQRTPLLKFPDYIRAEVVELASGQCGLLIDSRSRFGLTDFGVNRRRVTAWFAELRGAIGP